MLESKYFRLIRLHQIIQSEDNQTQCPSIIAKKVDNL